MLQLYIFRVRIIEDFTTVKQQKNVIENREAPLEFRILHPVLQITQVPQRQPALHPK